MWMIDPRNLKTQLETMFSSKEKKPCGCPCTCEKPVTKYKKDQRALVRCRLDHGPMSHEMVYRTRYHDGVVQQCHLSEGHLMVTLCGDGTAILCETMSTVRIKVDDDEIVRII